MPRNHHNLLRSQDSLSDFNIILTQQVPDHASRPHCWITLPNLREVLLEVLPFTVCISLSNSLQLQLLPNTLDTFVAVNNDRHSQTRSECRVEREKNQEHIPYSILPLHFLVVFDIVRNRFCNSHVVLLLAPVVNDFLIQPISWGYEEL